MSHYDTLGIDRGASVDEIKKAYRKLAVKHHPDKPGGDAEKFKKINQAHETLSDPDRRAKYDQFGTDDPQQQMPQGPDISQVFQNMFSGGGMPFGQGGGGGNGRRGDHKHVIELSLDEVFTGVTKTLKVTITKPCFACLHKCSVCNGAGMLSEVQNMGFISQMFQRPCHGCQGGGQLPRGCAQCHHQRHVTNAASLNLNISPGLEDGTSQVIEGLGEQARSPNERSGHLQVIFRIKKHPKFERNGHDLRYKLTVSFEESVNGFEFVVPHFSGPLTLKTHDLDNVIDPRKDYKVDGKGLTKEANLYINFDVQYPRVPHSTSPRTTP
jgi:DnaJ-class molecular chaperone